MRGRYGFARELELTIEEGTTESIAGCHCLGGDLCVYSNSIELGVLCTVFCVSWGVEVFMELSREEADSAIRKAALVTMSLKED